MYLMSVCARGFLARGGVREMVGVCPRLPQWLGQPVRNPTVCRPVWHQVDGRADVFDTGPVPQPDRFRQCVEVAQGGGDGGADDAIIVGSRRRTLRVEQGWPEDLPRDDAHEAARCALTTSIVDFSAELRVEERTCEDV